MVSFQMQQKNIIKKKLENKVKSGRKLRKPILP